MRIAVGKASVLKVEKSNKKIDKSWFKRIDHGEFLGNTWFDSLSDLSDKKLNDEYTILNKWIENV